MGCLSNQPDHKTIDGKTSFYFTDGITTLTISLSNTRSDGTPKSEEELRELEAIAYGLKSAITPRYGCNFDKHILAGSNK
jgi:hypothetical protein